MPVLCSPYLKKCFFTHIFVCIYVCTQRWRDDYSQFRPNVLHTYKLGQNACTRRGFETKINPLLGKNSKNRVKNGFSNFDKMWIRNSP